MKIVEVRTEQGTDRGVIKRTDTFICESNLERYEIKEWIFKHYNVKDLEQVDKFGRMIVDIDISHTSDVLFEI